MMSLHKKRYIQESTFVHDLAVFALNTEKNRVKPDASYYKKEELFSLLEQEIEELREAAFVLKNYQRSLEEIGDVAACLALLYSKMKSEKYG